MKTIKQITKDTHSTVILVGGQTLHVKNFERGLVGRDKSIAYAEGLLAAMLLTGQDVKIKLMTV